METLLWGVFRPQNAEFIWMKYNGISYKLTLEASIALRSPLWEVNLPRSLHMRNCNLVRKKLKYLHYIYIYTILERKVNGLR